MNKITLAKFGATVALAVCLAAPALAQSRAEMQEKRLRLKNRQAELLGRLDRVDDVARAESTYAAVRVQAFDVSKGLPSQASAWDQSAAAWLDEWQAILTTVSQLNSTNAAALADQLHDKLLSQATAYEKLRMQAQAITSSSSIWLAQLQMIPAYPAGYIKGYEGHLTALNTRIIELRVSVGGYRKAFSDGYVQRWWILLEKSRNTVDDLLKVALLHYPELEKTLQLARQSLQVSEKIDPAVQRVNAAFDLFNSDHLAKRLFHQDDRLVTLRQVVAASKAEIGASGLDSLFTDPALAAIGNTLAAAEQIGSAPLPITRKQMVAGYVHTQQRIYTLKCRDPEQARFLNCELLQTLNHFDQASIEAMNSADLRLVEYAFDKVNVGPSLGGF